MYWAEALAEQYEDAELKATFTKLFSEIQSKEEQILTELINAQGKSQDIGGYYMPNTDLAAKAMRPSETLNAILDTI
jgi:isocitrate dehydrogenase